MKRFLSIFLVTCMFLSTFAYTAISTSAIVLPDDQFGYVINTQEINGTQYIVATTVLHRNTGFASLEMTLRFNTAKLTVVTANVPTDYPNPVGKFQTGTDRITGEPTYSSGMSVFNIGEKGVDLTKVSFVKLVAVTGLKESTTSGDLFDAYFTVKDGYKAEDISPSDFTLEIETFTDILGKDVEYMVEEYVSEPTAEPTALPTKEPSGGTGSSSNPVSTPNPTPAPTAEPTVQPYTFPFTDVADTAWYRKDVENAHKKGLINGKSETLYVPDDNMTYAEAVKLACAINQLYFDGKVTLTNGEDVWYSTYMDYARESGIIGNDLTGVADNKITRCDFVKIFFKALPEAEYKAINDVVENKIPDVKMTDDGAEQIYTFYRAGILTGNDDNGTFYGDSNITRAEVAAIMTRMFDKTARKSIVL